MYLSYPVYSPYVLLLVAVPDTCTEIFFKYVKNRNILAQVTELIGALQSVNMASAFAAAARPANMRDAHHRRSGGGRPAASYSHS